MADSSRTRLGTHCVHDERAERVEDEDRRGAIAGILANRLYTWTRAAKPSKDEQRDSGLVETKQQVATLQVDARRSL